MVNLTRGENILCGMNGHTTFDDILH